LAWAALDVLALQVVDDVPGEGIVVRHETEPTTVVGDPVLLTRLVTNLVHNAIQYNRPGGVVDLRVTADARLTVRNTGPEIPAYRMGDLFEPFRRVHTTRTHSDEGSGLGLSIVAAIARAHDASITAHPNPGGGLEMTVQFRPQAEPGSRDHDALTLLSMIASGGEPESASR
jgi:signal transduction histidine kinase